MASTYQVNSDFKITTRETFDGTTFPAASSRGLILDQFNVSFSMNSTSTPPVTFACYMELTSGTSGTIDFTSLVCSAGTLSASGLKLQEILIVNKTTGTFSIVEGASNGYALGVASAKIPCGPASSTYYGVTHLHFNDSLSDVAGADKTIDWTATVAPTGTTEIQIALIFG